MKVTAVVEIPKGSTKKYEMDKVTGKIRLDRELSIPCPYYYGYIEGTLSEDSDPTDIFIITERVLEQGQKYEVELDSIYECTDDGLEDNKFVGYFDDEQTTEWWNAQYNHNIRYYLNNYKPEGNFILHNREEYYNSIYLKLAKERYNNTKLISTLNSKVNKLISIVCQTLTNEDKSKLLHQLYSID